MNLVPWYDTELVRLANSRDSLYNKALNSKSAIDWNIYKLRRQEFSKLFRTKKSIHHKKFIIENSKNTKKLLKKINPYTNPNKKVHINPSVFSKNSCSTQPADLANMFSNFFSSVTNMFSFLNLAICLSYVRNSFNTCFFIAKLSKNPKFYFSKFFQIYVCKALNELDQDSSPVNIGIETLIFKESANELPYFFGLSRRG